MRHLAFASSVTVLALGVSVASADDKNPTFDDVLPVFKQHCTNCHGNDKQRADLNLATFSAMMLGGSSGPVVEPGDPDKSRLYTLTAHVEEPKMPPESNKIPDAQIALLKTWIEQGARENASAKAMVPKPKVEIGLTSIVKGRPEGPPPMPAAGALPLDPVVHARRPGAVLAIAASPWAPVVAIGGQKQVILYDTDTHRMLGVIPFEHGQINSIVFSRNAQFILIAGGNGGQEGKAALHEIQTGKKIVEVGIESDSLLSADISADQKRIAVGSPSRLIRIYSTADGSVLHEIKKHTDWVTSVAFSPDGVLLATGDRNGGLFVWEAFTGRQFYELRGHTGMITGLSWRDDSNVLASASEDGSVKTWNMQDGNTIKSWGAHGGGAASVCFTHDGKIASTGRDKVTKLWDQNGAAQKQFPAFPDLGLSVAVSHDDKKVIAGDWSGAVKVFDAADGKEIATLDANPAPVAVRAKRAEEAVVAAEQKANTAKAAFEAAQAKATQAGEAHTAAQANLNKINADLAAAKKAVTDQTNAVKAAKPKADAAKKEVDQLTPVAADAAKKVKALEADVTKTEIDAKRAAELAQQEPKDEKRAAEAKKTADAFEAAKKDLDAAKKAAADADAKLKAANEKSAAENKAYTDAGAALEAAKKAVTTLTPMVKPATDAIPKAKASLDEANKAVGPAKAALDAATAELNAAKESLDLLKAAVASAGK